MRKILFVVEAMGGGVFTYIVQLANQLANSYEVYLAYAVRPETPEDYHSYFAANIRLTEVKNFTRSPNPLKDIKALLEMREIAKAVEPDIIHLHSTKAGILGRWGYNGKRYQLYYTPHGYSFLMTDHSSLKRFLYYQAEVISSKRLCTTISCSPGEHQETLKMTKRAHYVNNGVDISELETIVAADHMSRSPTLSVFTLGRICPPQNPHLFNEIARMLPEVCFTWVGDGELRHLLTSPNIHVTGWFSRSAAIKLSLEADVFLLTTLWGGLPMSLLEAMYMKKVCVVSDVIGNRDVIKTGRNGYVCSTLEEYLAAITGGRSDESKRAAEQAHADIVETYNAGNMAREYIRIFEQSTQEKSNETYSNFT